MSPVVNLVFKQERLEGDFRYDSLDFELLRQNRYNRIKMMINSYCILI